MHDRWGEFRALDLVTATCQHTVLPTANTPAFPAGMQQATGPHREVEAGFQVIFRLKAAASMLQGHEDSGGVLQELP